MLCYKDMTFCNATDCAVKECRRNQKGFNCTPDDFWKDKICVGAMKDKCPDYKKEEKDDSMCEMQNKSNR